MRVGRRFNEGGSIRGLARGGGLRVGRWRCMAQAPTATQEPTPQPGDAPTPNQPVALTITCAELKALFKAGDKRTAGVAILWLDGYYAGRSGLSELPAGWARTVSQGVGGTCAITVNDGRTVLDVVGQLHREYAGPK
jgi:hypothetical protein